MSDDNVIHLGNHEVDHTVPPNVIELAYRVGDVLVFDDPNIPGRRITLEVPRGIEPQPKPGGGGVALIVVFVIGLLLGLVI